MKARITVLLRLQNGTPNFVTNSKFGSHSYKMSDGYNVYHNIKCSHDDGFDAITLKKEWQIDFWLNLLDDGFSDTWILRKNRYYNTQTSLGTSLAWSVDVTKIIDTRLDFRYMHSGGSSQNVVSSLSNALNTQNVASLSYCIKRHAYKSIREWCRRHSRSHKLKQVLWPVFMIFIGVKRVSLMVDNITQRLMNYA